MRYHCPFHGRGHFEIFCATFRGRRASSESHYLGNPHRGTEWSKYSILPHIRELVPQSTTIETLNHCPPPTHTRAIAISGSLDIMMRPKDCTWWEGVRNIHLSHVGHAGLLFSRRVLEITLSHLNVEDPQLKDSQSFTTMVSPRLKSSTHQKIKG